MHKAERRRKTAALRCLFKPMNLNEMAKEYRANAEKIKERIEELKRQDTSELPANLQIKHQGRIRLLEGLYHDAISLAKYLENYYILQNRCDRE